MDIRQILKTLQRWWWLILAGTVAASSISYLATRATPKTYWSQTTLMVGGVPQQGAEITQNDIGMSQTLADLYASLALREPILSSTLNELKLTDWSWELLRDRVSTRVPPNSSMIEVSVVDTDPSRAQIFADAIGRQIIAQSNYNPGESAQTRQFTLMQLEDLQKKILTAQEQARKLEEEVTRATSAREIAERRNRIDALQVQITGWQSTWVGLQRNLLDTSPNSVRVLEPAALPTVPIGPKMTQNVAIATIVGLVVSLIVAFALELVDDTIKTTEDARKTMSVSVLGTVAHLRGPDYPSKLVAARTDSSRAAEAFRVLRTNLQFSSMGTPFQTLMVTSTRPKEGKSVTSSNLSTVIAQSGKRTILVDCDLRRPTQHTIFELENEKGFTTMFLDEHSRIEDVATKVSQNLWVIPSGPIPHNPAELLDSVRMGQLIELLKNKFDLVVFDVPPVLSVADATILGAKVDAVLMVVDSGFTRRTQAKRAKDALVSVGARVLGVVVNRVSEGDEDEYYYEYTSRKTGVDGKRRRKKTVLDLLQPQRRNAAGGSHKPVKLTKPPAKDTAADRVKATTNGHGGEKVK
jgi:polysaccharide biosynthesis transport protein